ncbi:hypothetical protein ACIRBX_35075 [Kitasatospora sp. NPDC096147]|uniref:hypothetical protein n=1 Tax=Kitasatospora sp. NPDC096147 TaxID=3364093 RepID=UPI00382EE4C0
MDDAWTAEQADRYRIGPDGQEFLGIEPPLGEAQLDGSGPALEAGPGDHPRWTPELTDPTRATDTPLRSIPWDHSYDND